MCRTGHAWLWYTGHAWLWYTGPCHPGYTYHRTRCTGQYPVAPVHHGFHGRVPTDSYWIPIYRLPLTDLAMLDWIWPCWTGSGHAGLAMTGVKRDVTRQALRVTLKTVNNSQ